MNPFITKKLDEFRKKETFTKKRHGRSLLGDPTYREDVYVLISEDEYKSALEEALLAGIEMAEGVVPKTEDVFVGEGDARVDTFRTETLSALKELKAKSSNN